MLSRRQFLGATATTAAVATAGCLGSFDAGGDGPTTDETPTTNATTTAALSPGEQTRGEAKPVSTTETITADRYEYVEANDTVRYPATRSGGEVSSYGYSAFGRWAKVEGASAAGPAILGRLDSRLESMASISAGFGSREESDQLSVYVAHVTLQDRSGSVIDEPEVPIGRVVAETPRSVEVTIEFAGNSGTHSYPVFVRRSVRRQQ